MSSIVKENAGGIVIGQALIDVGIIGFLVYQQNKITELEKKLESLREETTKRQTESQKTQKKMRKDIEHLSISISTKTMGADNSIGSGILDRLA